MTSTISLMNKEYLNSLDNIRSYFKKSGVISLQDFFDEIPKPKNINYLYQPANYKYGKGVVVLVQLSIDFLENITNKKMAEIYYYSFSHTCFDLRKFFEKEGFFFVINIGKVQLPSVGGEVFVVKGDEPLTVPSLNNAVTLIQVTPDDESFVTYVNHLSKSGSVDLIMGFLI